MFRYIVMELRSTRDIEILFKLIVKVSVVGNTADTPKLNVSREPVTFAASRERLKYNFWQVK